jgi:hypothetical protein
MKLLVALVFVAAVSGTQVAYAGNSAGAFSFTAKMVKGQHQLRGHFGSAWSQAEVKTMLKDECKSSGKTLVHFALGNIHPRKGTGFMGVCG